MVHLKQLAAVAAMVLGTWGVAQAQAVVNVSTPGQWYAFDVDDLTEPSGGTQWIDITTGQTLSFTFSITGPAELRIVDAVTAGDTFSFLVNGISYVSSAVAAAPVGQPNVGYDYAAAYANPAFSRAAVLLSTPGSYTVTGSLLQSATFGGTPLNATNGALMLTTAPVSEASTWILMLGGLGVMGVALRRRA